MNAADVVRVGMVVARHIGPVTARAARDRFGGWEEAAAAAERAAPEAEMPPALRDALRRAPERGRIVRRDCDEHGVRILLRGEPDWPDAVECLTDPPEVLFLRGRAELLGERAVGIVGSRECSREGAERTRRIAGALAEEGWLVVSGMARGVDAAAHEGALAAGGDTAAVLGTGPETAYPPENAALQRRLAADGLLVSEFAPGTPPVSGHFPRRNRILAALSAAVLVVECRVRSGALVTAKHALEQGKEIFVTPGRPEDPLAGGPLQLLRQGARPVRHAADLLDDLGGIPGGPATSPDDARTLDALREGARTENELARALGVTAGDARERLARLELLGLLTSGSGP
jgi:DNA processing protein